MAYTCLVVYIAEFTQIDTLTRNSNTYALSLILKKVMGIIVLPGYAMNVREYWLYYLNG